jgi:type I restriction enzyme S subunit
MKSEWRKVRLGDAPLKIIDGDRGKNYPPQNEFSQNGYCLFLNTKNVRQKGFDFSECLYISKERDELLRKGKLERNDTVLTTRGTIGNIAFYDTNIAFDNIRINSGMVIIRPDPDKLLPRFCFYLFQKMQDDFRIFTSGSAQPQLPIKDLNKILIPLPPLPTQRSIAAILSCLDDKIELNNRINANLEAQAQAIFKSWFVDFELFRDGKFADSELGRIPKGWRVGTLGEIINLFDFKRIPISGNERLKMNKIYPYYGAAGLMDYVDNYIFDGIYLLFGEDGTVIDSSGYPILQYVWGKFWVNNHAHIIQGANGWNVESLYILLKQTNIRSLVTGAVQPKINQINLKALKVIIPPISMINRYNDIIAPLFAYIRVNRDESHTLTTIRDALLPKLMSGEVEVEEANK